MRTPRPTTPGGVVGTRRPDDGWRPGDAASSRRPPRPTTRIHVFRRCSLSVRVSSEVLLAVSGFRVRVHSSVLRMGRQLSPAVVQLDHADAPEAGRRHRQVRRDAKTKSRDAARPFDPMPPLLRPPGTGTFRLRARPGSARASVSNSPQYVFVLAR